MPDYSFRARFRKCLRRSFIDIEAPRWELRLGEGLPHFTLAASQGDPSSPDPFRPPVGPPEAGSIKEATCLVLVSDGWPSADEAARAGRRYSHALMLTFARLGVGLDLLDRASPQTVISEICAARDRQRCGHPVLPNNYGLAVFESQPAPRFFGMYFTAPLPAVPEARFEEVLSDAVQHARDPSLRERIALELFSASFFEQSSDARFLLRVMAVEALLEPAPRSPAAQALVRNFQQQIAEAPDIPRDEKAALCGSAKWLMSDSISQTGRKLAERRLGSRQYGGMSAKRFFSHCYDLRSRLVHGDPPIPSFQELEMAAAPLEGFLSDLLAAKLPA